jgi:hypothetical protein
MNIPDELKKLSKRGDLSFIQEVYAERHSRGENPDYDTVSIEYIRLVLSGQRASESDKAQEILAIAIKLFEHKRDFIDSVLVCLLMALCFIFSSCHLDPTLEYKVDEPLLPHVDKFFEEASNRGLKLDRFNIMVIVVSADMDAMKGKLGLSRKEGEQRVVMISDEVVRYWAPESLEFIVFHELGHALLGREHCSNYSIMNIEISSYEYWDDADARQILVDELFSNN